MGLDGAVRGGDRYAGQHEPGCDLLLVEEGLVLLIDAATDQLARTGGARASTAGNGQINGLIGCGVKDRLVIGAVDRLVEPLVGIDEGDLEGGHGCRAGKGPAVMPS